MSFLKILTLLIFQTTAISCAKILGVFLFPSVSHQVVYTNVMAELSKHGHEVTVITTDPISNPNLKNYTEIDIHNEAYDFKRKSTVFGLIERLDIQLTEKTYTKVLEMLTGMCELHLSLPQVQKLIQSGQKFDLIFIIFLGTPCLNAYGYHYNAPIIGISSFELFSMGYDIIRAPNNPAIDTFVYLPYIGHRNLFQKLRCLIFIIYNKILYHWYILPKQDAIARKYFGDDLPYIGDLDANISLVMAYTNPALLYPRANVPALIEIGGGDIHFSKPKKLPKVREREKKKFFCHCLLTRLFQRFLYKERKKKNFCAT